MFTVKPECIIFDFDGVLCDSEAVHKLAFMNAFVRCDLPWKFEHEEAYASIGNVKTLAKLSVFMKLGLIQTKHVQELHEIKQAQTYEMIKTCLVHPFVKEFILKNDYRYAIVSDANRNTISSFVNHNGLTNYFDAIVTSDDANGKTKPAPDVYVTALSTLNVSPNLVVVFEDTIQGIIAAQKAGIIQVYRCDYHNLFDTLYSVCCVDYNEKNYVK